ncbi:MAG TPA: NPCBM/NEW2 domain-containing protein, partial [Sediminibacterium sp.]|nr:NPCBM/NEW2 domain-containing protein [Sediminibacterium sp.]
MKKILIVLSFFIAFSTNAQPTQVLWLDDLPIPVYSEGIPAVVLRSSAGNTPLQLGGQSYTRGLGVHSTSVLSFMLEGKGVSFSAKVGADDLANPGMITQFYVIGDRKILFESGDMKAGDPPKQVQVDLRGVQRLGLLVTNKAEIAKNYSDWADARFEMLGNYQPGAVPNNGKKYILTPKTAQKPAIHSPGVFGARPGNPFLFCITATGAAPLRYAA